MDIFKSNGELFTSIADGTTTTLDDAPVILAGRNYAGYGKVLNENQLRLAENFASNSPPPGSLLGQLWFNTQTNRIYVYKGDTYGYKGVAVQVTGSEEPENAEVGDIWFDTINDQLKIFAGTGWQLIGPNYDKNLGETGAIPAIIKDTNNIGHIIIKIVQAGQILSIISSDEFIPHSAISGFDTIRVGYNVNSLIGTFMFHGTSRDSANLGGSPANKFVRVDQNSTINADVHLNGQTTVKTNLVLDVLSASNAVRLTNIVDGADFEIAATTGGITSPGIVIAGATGEAQVRIDPITERGISSKQYVDVAIRNLKVEIENELSGSSGTTGSLLSILGERITKIENNFSALRADLASTVNSNSANIEQILIDLAKKAPIESPMFIGIARAQTPSLSADDDALTTAEWVKQINNDLLDQFNVDLTTRITAVTSTLNISLDKKAPKHSPIFTGEPRTTETDLADNSTRIATTSFVNNAVNTRAQWEGSRRFISTNQPNNATGDNGDFWFVIAD